MNDEELERLLRTPERRVPLAPFADLRRGGGARPLVPALALVVAVVVGLVAGTRLLDLRQQQAASPSASPAASASPPASPSASATPSASPTSGTASTAYENPVLGYRIALPRGYRRSFSNIVTAAGGRGGTDYYTLTTEAEARAACERDTGHTGGQGREDDVHVSVSLDARGMSAFEWATTPQSPGGQPVSQHQRVERLTVNGYEAVRLYPDQAGVTETRSYVIRANDRIYWISPVTWRTPSALPKGWLDDIVRTFTAVTPQAFPAPTPTADPASSARLAAGRLADAFAARDADAVRALMPDCWIAAWHWIDGKVVGMGPLNRSVSLFTRGLRDAFAKGLSVSVERQVQTETEGGRTTYFVRSEWREAGKTIRADLFLDERDGRWQWSAARHQLRSGEEPSACVAYPSPWTRPDGPVGCPP
ncbi:MAG TPA: hypothetical protein VFM93_10260 [Candidatus Limnocylindria bacterium]|nr:hypothetical protein [Candidatus Limnocylindria bacterium]